LEIMTTLGVETIPQRFPSLDLTPAQELALLARVLHREGYDDHLSGHITFKQPDGTFLVNPWGLSWDELRASDVARMDADAKQLEGRWLISPAITLHVVLHRHRHNAGVVVHNHPRWGTIWADAHRVPPVYDQTGAMYSGQIAVYDDYAGPVNDMFNSEQAVQALGSADVALLANHGVLVIGKDVRDAYMRSMILEWRCRQAWHVEALGGGVPMRDEVVRSFGALIDSVPDAFDGFFEAMSRRVLREDPSVLD
jgi:ribulose-5-phosphate 4-epimerase/fuculose-1-phosphate aldolase